MRKYVDNSFGNINMSSMAMGTTPTRVNCVWLWLNTQLVGAGYKYLPNAKVPSRETTRAWRIRYLPSTKDETAEVKKILSSVCTVEIDAFTLLGGVSNLRLWIWIPQKRLTVCDIHQFMHYNKQTRLRGRCICSR